MFDPLTLDQMRVLVAVAEAGSFSAAARRLGRVQSAISQAVQTMEATLGIALFDRSTRTPVLTEAGAAIVKDARAILESAKAMRARAESMTEGVEPELTLAVDAIFPTPLLMASLNALRGEFPKLPATVFTEALGGAEQRLREGAARMAIYTLPAGPPRDLNAEFLTRIALIPVVAAGHPLARVSAPIAREALEPHVQLVLTDRTLMTQNTQAGVVGPHIWRFADLSTRLEFLIAGFGWCNMPWPMVEGHYRRRPPETARHRRPRPRRIADLRRPRARALARSRQPLAGRRSARTPEDLSGSHATGGRAGSRRRRAGGLGGDRRAALPPQTQEGSRRYSLTRPSSAFPPCRAP